MSSARFDAQAPMMDPKRRFSGRAESYARHRPGYPKAVLDLLEDDCGLTADSIVADVASGTGLLSGLFLANGNRVFGVEPNGAMRAAAERRLGDRSAFTSVAGSAEDTTLPAASVDLVAVGQAFHWFDAGRFRAEMVRILKVPGWVALLWNEQRTDATPFLAAYEALIRRYRTEEYEDFDLPGEVRAFFGGSFGKAVFDNRQSFDLEGLEGRLLSSSYAPAEDHPDHRAMMGDLEEIFRSHHRGGRVTIEYDTLVYYGRLR